MQEDRLTQLEESVRQLQYRLLTTETRLQRLERQGAKAEAPTPVTPPPVISAPPRTVDPPPPPPTYRVPQAPTPPKASQPKEDTEYLIGAKILPKVGAAGVLLALLYFVYWGFSDGWITPAMVFAGELIFCALFVGIGQWKRNEREQYGQILTGIGSCGLYFTFAGGHLAYHMYSGEALVGMFVLLSFANLLYGWWSSSRAFLGIGLIGGLAGAMLPLDEHKYAISMALHLAIVIPAAIIAGQKKWADMAGWLFLFGYIALLPTLTAIGQPRSFWISQTATLYVTALLAAGAYAHAFRKGAFDQKGVLAPVMLLVAAFTGLALQGEPVGALSLVLVAVATAGLSSMATSEQKRTLVLTGIGIAACIAPFCFRPVESIGIFVGLSFVAAALAYWKREKAASAFAQLEFSLAVFTYIAVQTLTPLRHNDEILALVGLIASAVATVVASVRSGGKTETWTLACLAVTLPFFGRLGLVALGGTGAAPTYELAVAQALLFFALAVTAVAAVSRWFSAVVAMWLAFAAALAAYAYAVSEVGVPVGHETAVVLGLVLAVFVGLPVALGNSPGAFKIPISSVAFTVVGLFATRLAWVLGSGWNGPLAMCLAAAAYSLGSSAAALAGKKSALVPAWTLFATGGSIYLLSGSVHRTPGTDMAMISSLLAAFIVSSFASAPTSRREPALWHVFALLGWTMFSRWLDVAISYTGTDMKQLSSVTVAWIIYALTLLTIGFAGRVKEFRYWSFAVMFTSVGKILLVDLSNTPVPFRVAVLLGLGLVMLGGGYWYIRGRQSAAAA